MTTYLNETVYGMGLAYSLAHGKAFKYADLFHSNTLPAPALPWLAHPHSLCLSFSATLSEKPSLTTYLGLSFLS